MYLLRTPEGFINRTDFLADVGKSVQLVLYQLLMDGIFKALVHSHFQHFSFFCVVEYQF